MLETALTGEDHRDIVLVAAVDHVPVSHRSARLDDRRDAFADADLDTVAEGKKGVRDHTTALESAATGLNLFVEGGTFRGVLQFIVRRTEAFKGEPVGQLTVGLIAGDFGYAHAVLLAGADSDCDTVLDVEDRVAGDTGFDEPAKKEVV